MSCVTCHNFFLFSSDEVVKLVDGGSVINGATRLVFKLKLLPDKTVVGDAVVHDPTERGVHRGVTGDRWKPRYGEEK